MSCTFILKASVQPSIAHDHFIELH